MKRRSPLGELAEIALVLLVLICAGAEYGALYTAAGRALGAFNAQSGNLAGIAATLGHP